MMSIVRQEHDCDIFLDTNLKSYVVNKIIPNNTSVGEAKIIQKLAKKYKYDLNQIWYRNKIMSNENDDKWCRVPSPNERKLIVEKAHLYGHFVVNSTFQRWHFFRELLLVSFFPISYT